jgi:hypothetical protein
MGYLAMRTEGRSHAQVVRDLAAEVVRAKQARDESNQTRTGGRG